MVTQIGRWLFSRVDCLLLLFACLQIASSVHFNVTDEKNISCILADLAVNFSVAYNDVDNTSKIANFELPKDASLLNSSSCDKGNFSGPLLEIGFGAGNRMAMNFTKNSAKYQVDVLTLNYNLSDAFLFPNASEKVLKDVTSQKTGIEAEMNTTYKCTNQNSIHMGNVNATFYNIRIQAYPSSSNFSGNETLCSEDVGPPTLPPPVPTPISIPKSGKYQVNGTNSTCILADMGLQLNITYLSTNNKTKIYLFNIDPQNVTVSGNCNATSANLMLRFEKTSLSFMFIKNDTANKFHLGGVDVNTTLPSDANVTSYRATNESIMYLQATVGKSYMCKTTQVFITDTFSINAFSVRVQAFKFDGNNFGTAEECQMDEDSILVPIIVGAALAGLVLIVLIAYLIGRKRSHAGYQTI
uniref:Lysosome-associated membrane glycoprotein 1 n=1 Tax=Geotrypetes seraphini TaxID=260995 RepID=A0A6P8RIV0_GEOSA|nr:lysosome-associated membrane glycoprotein 1 [Geotrypetes seraphini]